MSDSDKSKQESQTAEAYDDIGYVLTFGNSVLAPDKTIGLLELWQSEQINFQDNANKYSLTLHGVKFNRKIYQPGEILAELDIIIDQQTVPSLKSIADLFAQRMVKMDQFQFVTVNNKKGKKDRHCVASNYYVYEVNPQLVHGSAGLKICVKLSIYSVDKLMTLNKYSKVYTNKKLGSGILMPESRTFAYQDGKDHLIKTDIGNMCFLKYPENLVISVTNANAPEDADEEEKTKKMTATVNAEFIHPYLVQYNESFYDFLSRTANRCGEFLFFEDGKVTLGLPDSGEAVEITDFKSVTYQEVVPPPLSIPGYARDSVKDGNGKVEELNQTPIEKTPAKYPMDVFASSTAYNSELAVDEFIFPLEKDKFSKTNYEMRTDGTASQTAMAILIPFFRDLLTNESAGVTGLAVAVGKNFAIQQGVNRGLALKRQSSNNSEKAEIFLTPYAKKPEHSNDTVTVQFGTLSEKGWTTLNYFNDVRCHQEEQQRQTICIDLGTDATHFKLGQKIKVKGCEGEYVIIEIRKRSGQNWNNDYGKYDQTASDKVSGVRSQIIYAIPSYKDKDGKNTFIPPVNGQPIIRKSGSQTAFVVDNADPKLQGRVRIAYPWQSVANAQRAKMVTAQQTLKRLEKEESEVEARFQLMKELKKASQLSILYDIKNIFKTAADLPENIANEGDVKKTFSYNEIKDIRERRDEYQNMYDANVAKINTYKAQGASSLELNEALEQFAGSMEEKEQIRKSLATEEISKLEQENAILEKKIELLNRWDELGCRYEKGNKEERDEVIKQFRSEVEAIENECDDLEDKLDDLKNQKKEAEEKLVQETEKVQKSIAEDASPWIRVSSPMATPGGGAFFKPQVGDEVLINYDNDNIDRPYVVGGLFSKNNPVPQEGLARYTQPLVQQKDVNVALMSPNGHHITFTDPEYGGNFFTNALSPGIGFWSSVVGLDKFGKSAKDLAGGIHIGDRYGMYEIEMLSHKRTVNIKSPFGTVGIDAFAGITINAPNGDVKIRGKNITLEAGNKVSITSGNNIQPAGIGSPDTGHQKARAGVISALGAIAGGVVDQLGASVVDLSLIRHVVEVFVRPVDGTMLIKSKRFLKLEAGAGNATIRRNRYAKSVEEKKETSEEFYKTVLLCVNHIDAEIHQFYAEYKNLWVYASKMKLEFEKQAKSYISEDDLKTINVAKFAWENKTTFIPENKTGRPDAYKELQEKLEKLFNGKFIDGKELAHAMFLNRVYVEPDGTEKAENVLVTDKYGMIKHYTEAYALACTALYNHVSRFLYFLKPPTLDEKFEWMTDAFTNITGEKVFDDGMKKWEETYAEGKEDFLKYGYPDDDDMFSSRSRKYYKRAYIMLFLGKLAKLPENKLGTFSGKYMYIGADFEKIANGEKMALASDYWWKRHILAMDRWCQKSFFRTLWDSTLGKIWEKLKGNFRSFELDVWKDAADGQILFSDKENATIAFENGGLTQYDDANIGTMDHLKKVLMSVF